MSEQESGQVSEQEKEAIEYIKAFQKDLYGASEKNLMAIYIDRVWNYIEKLQKGNILNEELINEIIKKLPFDEGVVTKENLLEWVDFFLSEWDRLEDVEDRQFELSALNFVPKKEMRERIRELERENELQPDICRQAIILELKNIVGDSPTEYLKRKLEEKNISQAELAKRLGVNKSTITHYITGRIELKNLSADRITEMAMILDVPIDEFIRNIV